VAKLIGSPPGYLGHRETMPLLSQENLNRYRTSHGSPMSFLLFDEIEKASDAVWNLLLGILDKATLTLGDNRRVDFSQSMIFLTSNLGAREMEALIRPRMGLAAAAAAQSNAPPDPVRLAKSATEAARKRFTPEFINRLDKVVVFQPLDDAALRQILDLELSFVQRRLLASTPVNGNENTSAFVFTVSEAAKVNLLFLGTDTRYGARDLKRVLDRELVQPLANLIATGQARQGDWVHVDLDVGEVLVFRRTCECMPLQAMQDVYTTHSPVPMANFCDPNQAKEPKAQAAAGRSRR
jgi:ATP-dependent Clp protease ATP-binding subunit ClpA